MQIRCPKNLRQRSLRPPAKIKEPDCSGTFAILCLQKLHPEITSSRQHLRDAKQKGQTISIQPAKSLEPEFFTTRRSRFVDNATAIDELNHRRGFGTIVRVGKPSSNMNNAKRLASPEKYGAEIGSVPQKASKQLTLCVDPGGNKLRRRFEKIGKFDDRFQKGSVIV
jgi:hypothetical protein